MGEPQNRDDASQRKLRDFRGDDARTANEAFVAIGEFRRASIRRSPRASYRSRDCPQGRERSPRRTRAAIARQILYDAQAVHAATEDFAVAVIAQLAEDARTQSENSRPAQMVESHAADRIARWGPLPLLSRRIFSSARMIRGVRWNWSTTMLPQPAASS